MMTNVYDKPVSLSANHLSADVDRQDVGFFLSFEGQCATSVGQMGGRAVFCPNTAMILSHDSRNTLWFFDKIYIPPFV